MSAHTFGPEEFEGGLPGAFDSIAASFGGLDVVWDNQSLITEVYSCKFHVTAEAGGGALKALGGDVTELYIQFKVYFPNEFVFGVSGYTGFLSLRDNADAERMTFNIEDYGTIKLTAGGDTAYLPTVDIPRGEVAKIEIYVKKSATVGAVKVWVNNDVSGSPTFDSGNINTAATAFRKILIGPTYAPEALTTDWAIDDVIFDTAFIGAGKTVEQEGYRFRADDGNETAATWLASQDSNITRARNLNTRIRALINTGGDIPSRTFQLEYRIKGSGESWKKVLPP